jgi:superfamily II DNA/RNA helicase
LKDVKILCFDQMDDLVEVGHNNPIREIYKRLPSPSKVQKCIFGHSKYYLQIEQLELMKMLFPSSKPHNEIIFLPKPPLRMMNATHYKISVDREEYKRDRLFGVLEQLSIKRAIIYCNSRRKMDWLEHEMTERNINVEIKQLNYRMQSEEVNNVIEEFRRGTEGILICSDSVTSRWRDPNDCQLVINYDLPHHFLSYCTRLGCSEIVHPYRHIAITFTLGNDIRENYCLKEIEKEFNIEFDELTSQVKSVV